MNEHQLSIQVSAILERGTPATKPARPPDMDRPGDPFGKSHPRLWLVDADTVIASREGIETTTFTKAGIAAKVKNLIVTPDEAPVVV